MAVLIATVVCCGAQSASAGVRAFSATTGAEDTAFVKLGSTGRPSAVIPDGKRGIYVVGRLRVDGKARSIVHVLPDGSVDPTFRPSLGSAMVDFGAARGASVVLAGRFTHIDGGIRHNIAVLDAHTGRLSSWAPNAPYGDIHGLAFTPTRLVASIGSKVIAWGDGDRDPVWVRRLSGHATLVYWHGSIVAANGDVNAIDPADGALHSLARGFFFTQFQNIGGRLYYYADGRDDRFGETNGGCGNTDGSSAPGPMTGTTSATYVATAPLEVDATAPPGHIYACTAAGGALSGFTPPTLPTFTQYVERMAVVGTHLLVFDGTF